MRMKKDSGAGYIVLIIIILILGYRLYCIYDENRLDDAKVLDYVQDNISLSEVLSCYHEYDIKDYIYNKYIPSDIWDDVTILQDTSWWEIIDYGRRDMYGQTLEEFLNEEQKTAASWDMSWEEAKRLVEQQQG